MGHFITCAGDRPLSDYSKADGRDFKTMLMKLPANWNKRALLKGLEVAEAAEKAGAARMKPMSDKNLNKLLGFVSSFWNWAERHYDDCPANPLAGLSLPTKKQVKEERDPFTTQELQAIFTAPIYIGCQSRRFWKQPGAMVLRDAGIFWVPLISLFTGARSGEVIQLYVDDVRVEDGISYFDINADGDDKTIKNASSVRVIPIHRALVDIGFMEHVETRRQEGEKRLFPDLSMGGDGNYSSPFSKHFGRFLESLGIKRPEIVFHSFRHTFEDACRNSGVPHDVMNALQGHSQAGMAGRYGAGFGIKRLAEEMDKVRYEGLDLSHLAVDRTG